MPLCDQFLLPCREACSAITTELDRHPAGISLLVEDVAAGHMKENHLVRVFVRQDLLQWAEQRVIALVHIADAQRQRTPTPPWRSPA